MTATRGRRTARPTGDDREVAILATAERLLDDRPLQDISIDDLARGAGISRPTFYFYFPSKTAVLLALLDRVVAEAEAATDGVLHEIADDPVRGWRDAIGAYHRTFRAHRAVTLAGANARSTSPEVRELWAGVMERWVRRTADAITAERERGAAPEGLPARDLAVVLNSMNERVLYGTFAADGPTVEEPRVVATLLDVWLRSIYHRELP
jgi:TetR/AcrR family transcriptional regulator, ethionamide resistance regulator